MMRCWRYDDQNSPWIPIPHEAYVGMEGGPNYGILDEWRNANKALHPNPDAVRDSAYPIPFIDGSDDDDYAAKHKKIDDFWYKTLVDKTSLLYNPHLVTDMSSGAQYLSKVTNVWDSCYLDRVLAGGATMNIAVSGESKRFMVEGLRIPEEKIRVVPNGVDPSTLLPLTDTEKAVLQKRFFLAPDSRVACMHGRFDPRKNHIVIGRALAALPPEKRRRLVILCSGSREVPFYNTLVGELRSLGVLSHFRFTGWTATRDILGMSDLLIAPSIEESFLMTALEGFFMRVPVARSKTGGYDEMKDICLGYDAMDVKAWSGILNELAESEGELYSDMTDRAYDSAMSRFTSRHMTEKILDVYFSVI